LNPFARSVVLACRLKLSGSIWLAGGRRCFSTRGVMLIRTATLVGSIKERANAENFLLEPSACTTWSATSGSGQVLGLVAIPGRSKLAGIGFTREEAGVVDSKSGCD